MKILSGGWNMLALTRRVKESIRIGNKVSVTILEVRGNQVRLGITAPKNVEVHREEIYIRLQNERLEDYLVKS